MNPNVEDAAREYLSAGLAVIALTGKQPNVAIHKRGLTEPLFGVPEDAADDQLIHDVFTHQLTTGVGIVLPEHIVVVDIDGEEGAVALAELIGEPYVPQTAAASTGRGLHLYYATTKVYRTTKLAEKLDLKGVGGYVAAPPSLHPSGAIYRWLDPLVNEMSGQRVVIEWLPQAIVDMLARRILMQEIGVRKAPRQKATLVDGKMVFEDLPPDLSGLVKAVTGAKAGERNNMLNWAAWQARDDGVSFEDAMKELGTAAEASGLDAREVRNTIRSAYRARG